MIPAFILLFWTELFWRLNDSWKLIFFFFVTFHTNWISAVAHNHNHHDGECVWKSVDHFNQTLFLLGYDFHLHPLPLWRSWDEIRSGFSAFPLVRRRVGKPRALSSAHTTSRTQNRPRPPHPLALLSLSFDRLCICVLTCSMGVRVMDTSWVSRRGTRKCSSTPPCVHPPTPPIDAPLVEQPGEFSASPSLTPPPSSSDRAR